MKKRRRFSTIGNSIKEHYRELNNHIFKINQHEREMRQEFSELIELILQRFPGVAFLGDFNNITEFRECGKGMSWRELMETCFDDNQIRFTIVGNLSDKQESLLFKRLTGVFRKTEKYSDTNIMYYRFIFDFNEYFRGSVGKVFIEPYQVRKTY